MRRQAFIIFINTLALVFVYQIFLLTGIGEFSVSAQCYALINGDGVLVPCPDDPDTGDSDGDGIQNNQDNCPSDSNPDQLDTWGNEAGDACESASASNGSDGTSAFLQEDGSYHLWGDCYQDVSGNILCRKMTELHVCSLPYTPGDSMYLSNSNSDSFRQILVTYLSQNENQRTYQINIQHVDGFNIGNAFTVTYDNVVCVPPDADGDGVYDNVDLCTGNDSSGDSDNDGLCDDTDNDIDGDGITNNNDVCVGDDTSGDLNGDGICDNIDNPDGDAFAGADDYCPDEAGRAGGCVDLESYYAALDANGVNYQSNTVLSINEFEQDECNNSDTGADINTSVVIYVDAVSGEESCVSETRFASTDGIFISNEFCEAVNYQMEGCRMWVENRGDDSMGLPEDYSTIRSWCEDTYENMCFVSWEDYCQYANDPEVCSYESYLSYKNR